MQKKVLPMIPVKNKQGNPYQTQQSLKKKNQEKKKIKKKIPNVERNSEYFQAGVPESAFQTGGKEPQTFQYKIALNLCKQFSEIKR